MKHKLHGSTRIAEKLPLKHLNAANGDPYFGTLSAVVTDSEYRHAFTACAPL